MLTLNNFFMHRVSTANFQFLMIIMFHCGLYCRAVSTGTPPITRFSYTAVVHLTRFFQTKNRGKILSSTVFFRKKAKNWTKKFLLKFFGIVFDIFFLLLMWTLICTLLKKWTLEVKKSHFPILVLI